MVIGEKNNQINYNKGDLKIFNYNTFTYENPISISGPVS